jgi:hypothetical protein
MALVISNSAGGYTISDSGGTSAAAPLWAGVIALADRYAGHVLGFVNPSSTASPAPRSTASRSTTSPGATTRWISRRRSSAGTRPPGAGTRSPDWAAPMRRCSSRCSPTSPGADSKRNGPDFRERANSRGVAGIGGLRMASARPHTRSACVLNEGVSPGQGVRSGVRRQGLEPRTRGLRVRCSARFCFFTSYHFMPGSAVICRTVRQPTRARVMWCRPLPGRTATSEQPWSKHGRRSFARVVDTFRNDNC